MASIVAMACGSLLAAPLRAQERLPKKHRVAIRGFRFDPELIEVKPGDVIIWTNYDIAPHTATAHDNSWDTGLIATGISEKISVSKKFAPDYFCRFHPMMQAKLKIVVSP